MPPKKTKSEGGSKPTGELVNWYEHMPKKFIRKYHNPHYDVHHISIPFRACCIGRSGAGKTQTLMNIIKTMTDTFEKIYIITKNSDEPIYNWVKDKFKDTKEIEVLEGVENIPDIDKLDKEKQSLIVFDDLVNERNQKPMESYFLRARKKNASMIYISQDYYSIPKMIRNNMTYLIIKQVSSMKNLTMIAREFSLGLDKKKLTEIYHHATAEVPSFLMIDLEGEPQYRFRKNFTEFYEVPDADNK
jgi:ABC-type dipeptide/oligopeptide/nickel transport system ATPase component